jgi:rhodanese-related sulfurtransferase
MIGVSHYRIGGDRLVVGAGRFVADVRVPDMLLRIVVALGNHKIRTLAPVVVYCAYGFEVGCNVATALRQRGFDARYVRGGLAAWHGAEAPRAAVRPADR